jgi:predicted DNA-binding transcriptional regulator AlpA
MSTNLIDAKTAAEIAGVQTRTIWQYNRFGRMPAPATYIGRSPAWERSVIEDWAKEKESRKLGHLPPESGSAGPV